MLDRMLYIYVLDRISKYILHKMPNIISNKISDRMPDRMPDRMRNRMSEKYQKELQIWYQNIYFLKNIWKYVK